MDFGEFIEKVNDELPEGFTLIDLE